MDEETIAAATAKALDDKLRDHIRQVLLDALQRDDNVRSTLEILITNRVYSVFDSQLQTKLADMRIALKGQTVPYY